MENNINKEKVPFTQIANEVLNSKLLTFKAKGIYSFMMSKPNGWNFTIRSMAKQVKDGEDGIRSGLRELREHGVIVYVKHTNGTGTYHLKAVISSSKKPKLEKPVKALQHQNGEIPRRENPLKGKSTRISNKEPVVIKIRASNKDNSAFDQFWNAYPKKKDKKKAQQIWNSRKLDSMADQLINDVILKTQKDRSWIDGYAPYPTTYLNGDRWEDEVELEKVKEVKPEEMSYHDIGKIIKAEKEKRALEQGANVIGRLADNMRRG